ncbi:MAG: DnaJ domain-containing protein [Spirochaetes bacterium]|jgi:hypothetical protein|nr:DnaJ domain-containing protein [Spirochaetota bacterium]
MTQVQPNTQNYRILGAEQNATLEELKAAYHRVAKKTHPDLAPAEGKRRAELRMMRVNEAYMAILAERMRGAPPGSGGGTAAAGGGDRGDGRPAAQSCASGASSADSHSAAAASESGSPSGAGPARAVAPAHAVARPRDPGYTYYKLGFDFYRKGYTELYSKDPRIIRKQLAELRTYDYYLLTLTISALRHFEQSYRYFAAVLERAPESIWVTDARAKLHKLEKFNRIYQRICENLSRSLRAKRAEQAAETAGPDHAPTPGTDENARSEPG